LFSASKGVASVSDQYCTPSKLFNSCIASSVLISFSKTAEQKTPELVVEPSNARVGVLTGHGVFCSAVFENEINTDEAIQELNNFEGVQYWSETLATPLDAENKYDVLVSRLRMGLSSSKIINF
jgi:aspartate-semialdehyde dehydrogenase